MSEKVESSMSQAQLIEFLETVSEKHIVELKKASTNLPSSFWESYSAFCNTDGGIIILGVEEHKPRNIIRGVEQAEKIRSDFWNQVSNLQKISYRSVDNSDVEVIQINGYGDIILIRVNEAPDQKKPVYVNDRIENCYIRTSDGDRKCTREELSAFLRNAQDGQDVLTLDRFTMADIDAESLIKFKSKVHHRYPSKKYLEMKDEDFLAEIGGALVDRATGEFKLKRGTLLFLGKVNAIHEVYPSYHVDYFNRKGNNPRWTDRITDDEPSEYEMNLFNFYTIVHEKLILLQNEAFTLGSNQIRMPISGFDETLREALVNCIAHADYVQGYPSIKIEAFDGWFRFINPGKMLVSFDQFATGGHSRPRNEIIMKMMRLLGASERQGFGGPLIFKSAANNHYRMPEIDTDLEHTELRIWAIDLADSYPDMPKEMKDCLRIIVKSNEPVSVNSLIRMSGYSEYYVRKYIAELERQELIKRDGNGSRTGYTLNITGAEMLTKMQLTLERIKSTLR